MLNAAMNFALVQLDISGVKIILEQDDLADGLNGYVEDKNCDSFEIVIDKNRGIGHKIETLFHELIHVNQFLKKGLGEIYNTFKGEIPYLERWWEIEAIEGSRDLMKKYILEMGA